MHHVRPHLFPHRCSSDRGGVRWSVEPSLLAALDCPAPQLVLSDVNMPGFDGPHALAIVRERAPAARFVFLTGPIAEDATLPEADGVLLKHELHELPRLVRRRLEGCTAPSTAWCPANPLASCFPPAVS